MSNRDDEQQGSQGIRIVDRRRFDSTGEEKNEGATLSDNKPEAVTARQTAGSASVDTATAAKPDFTISESAQSAAESEMSSPQDQEPEISFSSFVLSLATQAMMQLGQIKAPDGLSIPVDPASAKQTIDILGVLQQKTKGNLDIREEGLLRDALQSLRMAFLRFR